MKNLFRSLYYSIKVGYGDVNVVFWIIIFPIILATFFYLSFGSLVTKGELENKINLGIDKESPYVIIYEQIDLFDLTKSSEEDGKVLLSEDKIKGFVKKDGNLIFAKSDIAQSIIKNVADEVVQIAKSRVNPQNFDFGKVYLKTESEDVTVYANYFYSLVAMLSFYGAFSGINLITIIQPWESPVALRVGVSPISKRKLIFQESTVAVLITIISTLILVVFIEYILKLNIFLWDLNNLIILLLGVITGVSVGVFIGVFFRLKAVLKTNIAILFINFLAFLDGMMSTSIKTVLLEKAPWIIKINPISLISDNLIAINVFKNNNEILRSSITLVIISLIFYSMASLKMRGDRYDSI